MNYLIGKLCRIPQPSDDVADCDLYGDEEPWQIWSRFRGDGEEDGAGENDLYFFTPLKKMTQTGKRFGRTVGMNGGTWRGEDTSSPGQSGDGSVNWEKRRYNYFTRENAEKKKKIDTGPADIVWIMHEYRLKDMAIPGLGLDRAAASSCALCILRRKRNDDKSKKKERVPFSAHQEVEVADEDWGDEEDESEMAIVEGKTSGEFDSSFEMGYSTQTDYCTSTVDADFGTSVGTGMEMITVDDYGVSDGYDVGNFIDFPTNTDHQSTTITADGEEGYVNAIVEGTTTGQFDSNFEIGCFTQTDYASTVDADFGTTAGTGMEMINVADYGVGDGYDVANFIDLPTNTDHNSTAVGADFGTTGMEMMDVASATADDGGKSKEVLVIPESEGYQFEDFFNGMEDGWLMGDDSAAGISFTIEELLAI
ncbi:NAC transcription factor NAM-2 [Linum grandiflorum]